jgi:hypothetical protein
MATSNTAEFIREFGKAIIKDEQKHSSNFLKKLTVFLSGIRAKLVFNEMTGALLRSYVQQYPNIRFIFSGSNKHLLLSMFSDYGRPFYQSGEIMHLDRLNMDVYADFIVNKFQKNGKNVERTLVLDILKEFDVYTFYVQFLFNRLYETRSKNITKELIYEVLENILTEREYIYYNYRNLLINNQFQLLKAIAKEDGIKQYSSKDFIEKYKLGTSSSVNRSLNTLLNKEMIYEEMGVYKVYDLFFANWLIKK